MHYTVTQLTIYPVKSLSGITVQEAKALPKGFEADRRWMLVDREGKMMTQREFPAMALLQPVLEADKIRLYHKENPANTISLAQRITEGKSMTVSVWDTETSALAPGGPADEWLSDILQHNTRLVYQPEESPRQVDERYARKNEHLSLADGFPYLLISQESLDHLNSLLNELVPMNRFRPNIVVSGCAKAHEEDEWKSFRTTALSFRVAKPCGRCIMTTVDQQKGAFSGKEPLKTLSTYRRAGNNINFGMNLLLDQPGIMRVGEAVSPQF